MSTTPAVKLVSDRIHRIEISATLAVVNEAAKLRAAGAELVDYGAGEPHFPTPRHIKDAAIAAIENDFTKYTAVAGILPLRQAVADRHRQDFGSDYGANEVVVSTGGKLALFNAVQVLVDHGDEVILPVPYWVSFKDIVQYAGGTPIYLQTREENKFRITPEMVERSITPRTRAIILNSPNNPSGAVAPAEDLREIVRLAHKRGIYVIADECYVYFNYAEQPFSVGAVGEAKEHMVIIGSLSKTYSMTGWRCGYSLAPAPVSAAIQKLQSQSTSSSNAIVQKAALAAMTGPQDCIQEFKQEYIRLRDAVLAGFAKIPGLSCHRPDGAFYVYPNVTAFFGRGGIRSAADVSNKLLHEAHVVTVPGEAFGTRDHIRLSYAVSMNDVERGLKRMTEFFAGL